MNRNLILIIPLALLVNLLSGCKGTRESGDSAGSTSPETEFIEDSLNYARSMKLRESVLNSVTPDAETYPVNAGAYEDSADDPAWFTVKDDPERVIIAGSNKIGGIHFYDIDGDTLAFYKVGRINNIDARTVITDENDTATILAGSNRDNNSILVFTPASFRDSIAPEFYDITTTLNDVYGLCLYHSGLTCDLYAFVNSKDGTIEQYRLDIKNNKIRGTVVRKMSVKTQPEGMVADDRTATLYVGEEDKGIHIFNAEPDGGTRSTTMYGSKTTEPYIIPDIEGLALFKTGTDAGFLVASIQGNFSYAVFDLTSRSYITSFKIEGTDPDGVEETDGIDIIDSHISSQYPEGVLIVQDGYNTSGGRSEAQNFKIIDWRKISKFLPAPVTE